MCIAIYAPDSNQKIELSFVQERIYQMRSGGCKITLDMLIKNIVPNTSISRLRVLVPFNLVDVASVRGIAKENNAISKVNKLRKRQLSQLSLTTFHLNIHEHESNWIYNKTVVHVDIDRTKREGRFGIKRCCPKTRRDIAPVEGAIKTSWEIQQLPANELNEWAWLLQANCELGVFDIARTGLEQESLSNESMWLRLEINIPPTGFNRKSLLERIFAQSLEYRIEFKSPGRVCRDARLALDQFRQGNFSSTIDAMVVSSKSQAKNALPSTETSVEVKDWRTFLYREYGLEVLPIDSEPVIAVEELFSLPSAADPIGCRRSPMPILIQWIMWSFAKFNREAPVVELFFGTEHTDANDRDDQYSILTKTVCRNVVYPYVVWIGLLLSIISVVLSIIGLR